MSADKDNLINWVATRKVDGEIEYLFSPTTWGPDKRFAKVFDTKSKATKYIKSRAIKGTVRKVS
tara:strand:+ start:124 stop:315 length:192 start_codon:yes stop_codon:yes gene_type:complete